MQAVAARVMATMARWQAAAGDDEEAQEDFLGQVPVEAICDHRSDNLAVCHTTPHLLCLILSLMPGALETSPV